MNTHWLCFRYGEREKSEKKKCNDDPEKKGEV